MRNKVAKKLKRSAEAATVGMSVFKTREKYQSFKKIYKGLRQRGLLVTANDIT